MKAAICKEFKKPLVIEDIPIPEIGPDEVLIKVKYCGICHSDLHIVDGDWESWVKLPVLPGHEVAGIVEKVGKFEDVNKALDDLRSGKIVLIGILKFN